MLENLKNVPDSSVMKDGYFSFGLSFELRCDRSSNLTWVYSHIPNQFI